MAVTHYQADHILDNLFGGTPLPKVSTLYFGLQSTQPNREGTGVTEPSGNGYVRTGVENNKTNFNVQSSGVLTNRQEIKFQESTGDWGKVNYVFIADSPSGGNVMYYDALVTPRTVESLTTLLFSPNALQVTLS